MVSDYEVAGSERQRPLLLDELAQMEDLPTRQDVPGDVAERLARPRLHIAGVPGGSSLVDGVRSAENGEDDGWELQLPAGAFVGRPGRTSERLDRAQVDIPDQDHTEAMRPAWVAQSFQPRMASQFTARPPMRRLAGTEMEAFYGVFGPDDRLVYHPGSFPWHCVGRIFTWTNWAGGGGWTWWGSGVLVGPRHVLTAGHVCPWGSTSWAMRFVPAYWNGSSVAGAGAESYVSDYNGWNTNNTVAAHDMAVLRLHEPIGSSLGWMGTKVYDSGWEGGAYWNLTGYPGMVAGGERPSYQSAIAVVDDDTDGAATEIEHYGDSSGGASGGPFFGYWGADPYAIGTTSGGQRTTGTPFGLGDEDVNVEAGGQAMVDLVLWALANWA